MLPGYRSGNGQVEWQEIKSSELHQYLVHAAVVPVLLDVRHSYEYSQGHIPGPSIFPLNRWNRPWLISSKIGPMLLSVIAGAKLAEPPPCWPSMGFPKWVYCLAVWTAGKAQSLASTQEDRSNRLLAFTPVFVSQTQINKHGILMALLASKITNRYNIYKYVGNCSSTF